MFDNPAQLSNAYDSIFVTLSGIDTLFNPEQFENDFSLITVIVLGIITSVIPEQSWKIPSTENNPSFPPY